MANTITSANATYALTIANLYPSPVLLQQFGADAGFDTESVETAEIMLGVDGIVAAGWLPTLTKQTVTLMANSISIAVFDAWKQAQDAAQDIYQATGLITMKSTGVKYALSSGTLSKYVAIPSMKKVLEPRVFEITWRYITPAST